MIRHKSDSQHSLATLSLGTRVYSRSPQHAVASIFAAPQLQRGDLSPTRLTCVFLAATGLAEVEPWLRHGHQGRGSHWARWQMMCVDAHLPQATGTLSSCFERWIRVGFDPGGQMPDVHPGVF